MEKAWEGGSNGIHYVTDDRNGPHYEWGSDSMGDTEWIIYRDPSKDIEEWVKLPYGSYTAPTINEMIDQDMVRRGHKK